MHTEFIFGCKLSKDTPKECLDSLDYVINGEEGHSYIRWNSKTNKIEVDKYERTTLQEDIDAFIEKWDLWNLFKCSSYSFGSANPIGKFYLDGNYDNYHISTRADLKNYGGQIENFIEYIKPYVTQGSGCYHNIFAYVQYEEEEFPTLYGIDGTYHVDYSKIKKDV